MYQIKIIDERDVSQRRSSGISPRQSNFPAGVGNGCERIAHDTRVHYVLVVTKPQLVVVVAAGDVGMC